MMLRDAKVDEHGNVIDHDDSSDIYFDKDAEDHENNVRIFFCFSLTNCYYGCLSLWLILSQIKSVICFLRGKAYEALDNRDLARQWWNQQLSFIFSFIIPVVHLKTVQQPLSVFSGIDD